MRRKFAEWIIFTLANTDSCSYDRPNEATDRKTSYCYRKLDRNLWDTAPWWPCLRFHWQVRQPDTSCSTCAKGVYNFQRIQGTQTDYISTMLTDANGHVNSFLVQSPGADWDVTTATAICESFGPSDVNYDHPLKVLQSSDGSLVEKVYKSAWLAGQLAKSDFQDGNTMSGNIDLPPGMFDISYSYSGGPSKVSDCVLAAGIERV